MKNSVIVQILKNQDENRKNENAQKAKQLGSQIHAQKHEQRMQPNLLPDDFRLDDVTYHGDDKIQNEKSHTGFHLLVQKTDQNPGNHDSTGSKYRQHIEYGNQKGDDECIFNSQDMQADGQLEKGQQHDLTISDREASNGVGEIVSGSKDDLSTFVRKLPNKKGNNALIIGIKEKRRYNGEKERDDQIWQRGRKPGEHGYQMFGQ